MNDFYVISLKHTRRDHRYITIWRPDDKGYCWALCNAGKYERERIMQHLGYYNSGCSNIAVPCSVLDKIAVPPIPGHHDNDAGPCVENNRANWERILANLVAPTEYQPMPEIMSGTEEKPLFIPLKRCYFEAFVAGTKREEYRPEGPRWNARTCAVGRPVVLSLGYGKAHRVTGVIVGYRSSAEPTRTPAWKNCYGDRAGLAACIEIVLPGMKGGAQ